jgi:hypothetical protein
MYVLETHMGEEKGLSIPYLINVFSVSALT